MATATEGSCNCTHEKTIEWPTAFFWLVCLALNSMTQPSGRVCEMPIERRFLLRSSPLICAVDAVGVLSMWLRHMCWHLESPTSAARRIARARFRELNNEAEEGSLSTLENNGPFRCTIFVLGALPAAIKLFASSGIPWIQTVGAMYLGSWVILELLVTVNARYEKPKQPSNEHRPAKTKNDSNSKQLRKIWSVCALAAHAIVSALIMTSNYEKARVSIINMWIYLCSLFTWLVYVFDPLRLAPQTGHSPFVYSFPIGFMVFASFSILRSSLTDPSVRILSFLGAFLTPYVIAVLLAILVGVPNSWATWRSEQLKRKTTEIAPVFLAFYINIQVSLIYFAFLYDSNGTSIPRWTRWLG